MRIARTLLLLPLAACVFDPRGVPPSEDDDGDDTAAPDARPYPDGAGPDAALPPDAEPPPDATLVDCPSNYESFPELGLHLRFDQSSQATWIEAAQDCANDAAPATYLAIAADDATNAAIDEISANRDIWIGISDAGVEGEYRTVFGDAIVFDSWGFGEPNDGLNPQPEDCVELLDGGDWNDRACGEVRRFVCACDPTRGR
jgi:hypothetical protein